MTKQEILNALESGKLVTYGRVFTVLGYNAKDDTYTALHKEHAKDPDMATTFGGAHVTYAKFKLTDKNNNTGGSFIMKNIVCKVEGTKLTIEIDLSQTSGKSKSGKNTIVASSCGNAKIEGTNMVLGLNLYTKDVQ